MPPSHPHNLMINRSCRKEAIKGGIFLGLMVCMVIGTIYLGTLELGTLESPLIVCSQGLEGIDCRLE